MHLTKTSRFKMSVDYLFLHRIFHCDIQVQCVSCRLCCTTCAETPDIPVCSIPSDHFPHLSSRTRLRKSRSSRQDENRSGF